MEIKLTEEQLRNIISESIKKSVNEDFKTSLNRTFNKNIRGIGYSVVPADKKPYKNKFFDLSSADDLIRGFRNNKGEIVCAFYGKFNDVKGIALVSGLKTFREAKEWCKNHGYTQEVADYVGMGWGTYDELVKFKELQKENAINNKGGLSKKFEPIYDEIDNLINKINTLFYDFEANVEPETYQKIREFLDVTEDFKDAAHELEEHLAWD